MNVLDKGYVELLDWLGHDLTPVESARVSYNGDAYADSDRNLKLLEYLYKNEHMNVLEPIVLKFRIKAPIFVFRQWHRHRLASISERSGRYTEFDEAEWYVPAQMRIQDTVNKQGSLPDTDDHLSFFIHQIDEASKLAYYEYQRMLNAGVAKELARIILPVNFYSEMIWTINMRSLFNFLKQRLDTHAQYEIRCYAQAIAQMLEEHFPENMKMFYKYILKNEDTTR